MAELVANRSLTNPLSQAFPSWEWNQNPPKGMYSVTNVQVDKFARVWMLDSGITTLTDIELLHNPKILIWSLVENKMLMVYEIPKSDPGKSVYTHLEIDTSRGRDDTYCIVSDSAQGALEVIKYNQAAKEIKSWRVRHDSFMSQPELSNFTYGKNSINMNLAVYSITIVPSFKRGQPDHLYYSSFAGNTWHKVPLFILYSQELWTRGDTSKESISTYFEKLGQVGYVTSARCNYDSVGFGFYCPAPALHAITHWDVREPFNLDKVLVRDDALLEYPVQILFNKDRYGRRELYVASNSLIVSIIFYL